VAAPTSDIRLVRVPIVTGAPLQFVRVPWKSARFEVKRIIQDNKGFLWFGAADGLRRYDGVRFIRLPGESPSQRSSGFIISESLMKDRAGMIWFGVEDFVERYDPDTGNTTQFRTSEGHACGSLGHGRQAFYTNLSPRGYRFRVIACNNSGVWNNAGAALEFSIAPAYYQTRWFEAAMSVCAAFLLWIAHQVRMRRLTRQFSRTLDARISERTRIARDLHDTLLQSFQGVLLRFQSVAKVLPAGADEARARLERALDQAEAAVIEGRNARPGGRGCVAGRASRPTRLSAVDAPGGR
jgi:Histidine kinase